MTNINTKGIEQSIQQSINDIPSTPGVVMQISSPGPDAEILGVSCTSNGKNRATAINGWNRTRRTRAINSQEFVTGNGKVAYLVVPEGAPKNYENTELLKKYGYMVWFRFIPTKTFEQAEALRDTFRQQHIAYCKWA